MTHLRRLSFISLLLGTAYACSGTPEVTIRGTPVGSGGGDGGALSGGVGGKASGGSGGSIGGTAGRIGTTGGNGGNGGGGKSGNTGGAGGNSSGGTGGTDEPGFGGFPDIDFDYDAGVMGQGGACDRVTDKGTLVKRPMDIIVSIDNSASMQGEIQAVQQRINDDFARIIDMSGIDYRVIMVSRYGNVFDSNYDGGQASDSAFAVCIGSPLSTLDCPGTAQEATPLVAHNPPRFYHHSTDIGSNNLWCRLLGSYDVTDPFPADPRSTGDQNGTPWVPIAPTGWGAYLRPEAFKVFIGITDDSPSGSMANCANMRGSGLNGTNDQAGADAFDTVLRTLAPAQFGAVGGERNYRWYSIIGMAGDGTTNPPPLMPTDPTVPTQCCTYDAVNDTAGAQACIGNSAPLTNGAGNGVGYQRLSILTGGLRYPSCYNKNFDGIFNAIAQGVIEGAKASCEYDVPVPTGGIVDYDQTVVSYLPMGNAGSAIELTRAATDMDCAAGTPGYYFNQDFTKIFLCPDTCVTVQADDMAEVSIDFGCLGS